MRERKALKIVEEATSTYDSIASHFSDTRFNAGPFLKELAQEVPDDAIILDIGCGNGRLVEVLPKSVMYTGIDVSDKLLDKAKELYPDRKNDFKVFSGVKIPYEDKSFSHIYMLAAFHHVPKPLQLDFLLECKRVLRPGGKIVMTLWHLWRKPFTKYLLQSIPNKLISRELDLFDIYIPWKNKDGEVLGERYFHMFRKHETMKLFVDAGFKNVNVDLIDLRKQKNYLIKASI